MKSMPNEIRQEVLRRLEDRYELKRVSGVGDCSLFGSMDYSMRVWFEVDRLNNLNVSPSEIISAIQAQNIQAAAGRIGARPICRLGE